MIQELFRNTRYLVLNKPPRAHFDELLITHSDKENWEPAHRLDYETSGALLFTKPEFVEITRRLFQDPDSGLQKIYLAGATAKLPDNLADGHKLEGWIGSRYRSSKKVLFSLDRYDKGFRGYHSVREATHMVRPPSQSLPEFKGHLYEVQLLTGGRHQIRAFFAANKASLVGDPLYGASAEPSERLELHSWRLEFDDPVVEGESIRVVAPIPAAETK